MKNAWIIAKRDMGSYFNSPVFYVVTTVFLVLFSYIFFTILNVFSMQSLQAGQLRGMGISMNLNQMVIAPSLANMAVMLLLIIPLLTMRSFAEEKKNKTFALLLSSPVHLKEIILGKFLACIGMVTLMILITGYSTGFLFWMGQPEIGPILTGYLGMILMAGCYIAMGVFASSLTDNQIIAAVLGFGFCLFMWIIGWTSQVVGGNFGQVLEYLSLIDHLERFLKGILDTSDLAYYLSFIAFFLFLTHRVLDSQRWR
ncbi:MAG: ABC transporter permease subunit [Nitrospinaceae bacterium]|nr:MAG: ABC transporter permease subunit [Nitrospinaceae bacterium]